MPLLSETALLTRVWCQTYLPVAKPGVLPNVVAPVTPWISDIRRDIGDLGDCS